jgi:hypothetical protein
MKARASAAVLATLMASGAAFGGDAEFDRIVKAIESHYGTRPQHIPFMGVANFFGGLRAPARFSRGSRARQTSPMPPRPHNLPHNLTRTA